MIRVRIVGERAAALAGSLLDAGFEVIPSHAPRTTERHELILSETAVPEADLSFAAGVLLLVDDDAFLPPLSPPGICLEWVTPPWRPGEVCARLTAMDRRVLLETGRIRNRQTPEFLVGFALAMVGRDGVVRTCNEAWRSLLGWGVDDGVGASIIDVTHAKSSETLGMLRHAWLIESEMPDRWLPLTLCRLDGSHRDVLCQMAPGGVADEYIFGCVDVTEWLARTKHDGHTSKWRAISTFAGGIAHEFNNLLASVLGHTELSLMSTEVSHPAHSSMASAHDSTREAVALVSEISALLSKPHNAKEVVHVERVFRAVESRLKAAIPNGVLLRVECRSGLAPLWGERAQFEEAVNNLATNAIQALGRSGGRVTLAARHASTEDVSRGAASTDVVLEISDTGRGIEPDDLDQIFDPFFTTKEVLRGRGLGLVPVRGLVDSMGGRVLVSSTPGQGTRFFLFLPPMAGGQPFIRGLTSVAPSPG